MSRTMSNSDTFQDFCQAWRSRFPHSELPAAWEEDVRANLAKHQARVDSLREELEKEEMYVEYLDKLLADIELHRQQKKSIETELETPSQNSLDYTVTSGTLDNKQTNKQQENTQQTKQQDNKQQTKQLDNKQKFLEDLCELHSQNKTSDLRASLHLDLETVTGDLEEAQESEGVPSSFVTVINVKSPDKKEGGAGNGKDSSQEPGSKFTFTKSKSSHKKAPPPPLTKPTPARRQDSRESLNSISSPLSPVSPVSENILMSPREAPASPVDSPVLQDSSSSESGSPPVSKSKPEVPARSMSVKEDAERKSHSSSEDLAPASQSRGRPDGGEEEEEVTQLAGSLSRQVSSSDTASASGKVADLRANWENKPPIAMKPAERRSKRESGSPSVGRRGLKTRTDSDSSRGRMGSPSGKSHDSSDSEHSWGRVAGRDSRLAGETRLDRLVRRPSAEKAVASLAPALPKPRRLNKGWQTQQGQALTNGDKERSEEPLYDTVANEEAEDDYDNHLLYTDTDLTKSHSLTGSGTLSSSTDTDGFSGSPSLIRKVVQMDDEESNYVNIQYFLHHTKSRNTLDRDRSLDPFDESEDEAAHDKTSKSPNNNSLGSNKSREKSINDVERHLMYKHILNSITESEAIYLECLSVSLQYMKAMKVTLATPQPVIPKEDFDVIFFKIPELHEFHYRFHESLKKQVERYSGDDKIGHHFKMLAQQTKVYAQFLSNYPAALETLHRCSQLYPQFADLTGSIKLRTLKGQQQGQSLSMEDLLHKPVARVQKNCLSLQDLIKFTPEDHPDFTTLTESLHMIQNFLNDYNLEHRGELYPHGGERNQRHLVKNSFTVELSDGNRKLRHLFLFNDVLVCAKYKASGRGEKFTFQLKWYIPLSEVNIHIIRIYTYMYFTHIY